MKKIFYKLLLILPIALLIFLIYNTSNNRNYNNTESTNNIENINIENHNNITDNTINNTKEDVLLKFYKCYETKNSEGINETLIDSLKVSTDEERNYQKLFFNDITSFKLLSIEENTINPVTTFNGKSYLPENIAEFSIKYEIHFDKNVYGTAGEGIQTVRKVVIREDKNSPWLIAGQLDPGY